MATTGSTPPPPTAITTSPSASGGKYAVQQLTFPEDLYSNGPAKYANSWVMININMLQQSKYLTSGTTVGLDDAERRREGNFDLRTNDPNKLSTEAAAAAATLTAASAIKNLKITDFLTKNKSTKSAALMQAGAQVFGKALATGVVTAAGVEALVDITGKNIKRETKRIQAAIQLPMPNALVTNYNMRWGEDSTAMFDAIMRGLSGQVETKEALAAATLAAAGAMSAGGLSAMTGLAVNPKKEMIFDSVGFRTFTLEYKLYPTSESEADNLKNIIYYLKFHMHPEYKSDLRYTFVYPSEFDITFYYKGEENLWINKIATCALTDLQVNYTPSGLWAQHEKGIPNETTITMTFKELTVLTKEMIQKGF